MSAVSALVLGGFAASLVVAAALDFYTVALEVFRPGNDMGVGLVAQFTTVTRPGLLGLVALVLLVSAHAKARRSIREEGPSRQATLAKRVVVLAPVAAAVVPLAGMVVLASLGLLGGGAR